MRCTLAHISTTVNASLLSRQRGRFLVATTRRSTIEVFDGACCPLLSSNLSEDQAVDLAKVFAALADPVRLRLLSIVASQEEVCSCELQEPLGKSQPTI